MLMRRTLPFLHARCSRIGIGFVVLSVFIWAWNVGGFAGMSNGQANELFSDASGFVASYAQQERERQNPTIKRSRHVQVNLGLLHKPELPFSEPPQPDVFSSGPPYPAPIQESPIVLDLFPDVSFTVIKDRVEVRSTNRYTWYGHIEGVAHSQVILVVEDGSMAGDIFVRPS